MRRYVAVVVSLGLVAVLAYAAQVPAVLSALRQIGLAPGDTLTINCSTSLSGSPSGQQATFTCAPNSTQTITFDGLPNPNRPLTGQYPNGLIDWGNGAWYLSGPYGGFAGNSISFNGSGPTSASFTFLSPQRLIQIDAFNGGSADSSVFVHCQGLPIAQADVRANQLVTIPTGWTSTCSIITIASTNGWDTNFNSLVIDSSTSASPTSTSTPAVTPTTALTATPTAAATMTPTRTATPSASTPRPTSNCPCSIFAANATPIAAPGGDTNSVEVGVKFRSDVAGSITGIRFYKLSNNTSPHIASLWSSNGTLLGRATFTNESGSGWQQVNFSTPISVGANTTYIASYHTLGHYAADQNYFANGVDRAPLHALANGFDGPNGLYSYAAGPAFPTSMFNASNYWVDVVFNL